MEGFKDSEKKKELLDIKQRLRFLEIYFVFSSLAIIFLLSVLVFF